LHAEVSAADPSASITRIACAQEVCRMGISRQGSEPQSEFVHKLSSLSNGSAAPIDRHTEETLQRTVVYVMNTTPMLDEFDRLVEPQ
jgi:hypothetical protein